MLKKAVILLVLVVLLISVTGFVYNASSDGNQPINWRIAGSVFSGIEVVTNPQTGQTASFTMLNLSAKRAPGKARVEVVGTSVPVAPTDECPQGVDLQLKFDGGFVATFDDLSMLFFKVDESAGALNAFCVFFNPAIPATAEFDYVITGGAGRFAGASGNATVSLTAWDVSPALSAEVGEIVGTIELP